MTQQPPFLLAFVTALRYVLALDEECADLRLVERRLAFVTSLRTEFGLDSSCWDTVHCVHDANPLDYTSRLHGQGGVATIADLATIWREHLHQGLTLPTIGTQARPEGRRALRAFAAAPRLVAQIRLYIRPADLDASAVEELGADLHILQHLWELPADSPSTTSGARRLQLVVHATDLHAARHTAERVMLAAGMTPSRAATTMDDPHAVSFASPEQPAEQHPAWYGIRTNGALFEVHAAANSADRPIGAWTNRPGTIDQIHLAAIRAGWAA